VGPAGIVGLFRLAGHCVQALRLKLGLGEKGEEYVTGLCHVFGWYEEGFMRVTLWYIHRADYRPSLGRIPGLRSGRTWGTPSAVPVWIGVGVSTGLPSQGSKRQNFRTVASSSNGDDRGCSFRGVEKGPFEERGLAGDPNKTSYTLGASSMAGVQQAGSATNH